MDNSIKNLETDLKNSARTTHDRDDKFEECMGSFAKDARDQCSILQVEQKKIFHIKITIIGYGNQNGEAVR